MKVFSLDKIPPPKKYPQIQEAFVLTPPPPSLLALFYQVSQSRQKNILSIEAENRFSESDHKKKSVNRRATLSLAEMRGGSMGSPPLPRVDNPTNKG